MKTPHWNRVTPLKPIADIPNVAGFKLTLFVGLETEIPCTVQKDANGLHVCVDAKGNYRKATVFDGWR